MLAFTLKVIIADIRRAYQGYWVILYVVLLGATAIAPFYTDAFYNLSYVIYIVFLSLMPQMTKVFYVLPLGKKLLRRHIHLRALVLATFFLIIGGGMYVISQIYEVPNVHRGVLMTMFYMQLCIILSFVSTIRTFKENKLLIITIALLLICNISNSLISIHFPVQLYIGIVSVIISEIMLITRLGKIELYNYEEPIYGFFGHIKEGNKMRHKQLESKKMR